MSTDNESELALAQTTPGFHKATSLLATTLGIEPRMMVQTLKKQCFPGQHADSISDAQLAAFISVANSLRFNPLVPGMLYAYPSKNGGIVPVTGPDGMFKVLDEQIGEKKLDGYECEVFPADITQKPTHAVATIWRAGNSHPSKFTAIFSEWVVSSNPNWGARPRHMLWLRAIKQCARQVIHGVPYDEDEVTIGDLKNVTPDAPPDRPPPPPKTTGAGAVKDGAKRRKAAAQEVVVPESEQKEQSEPERKAEESVGELPKTVAPVEAAKTEAPPIATTPVSRAGKAPLAIVKPGEKVTAVVTVVSASGAELGIDGVGKPVAVLQFSGELLLKDVRHIGGGEFVLDEKGDKIPEKNGRAGHEVRPIAPWIAGNKVRVTVYGKAMKTGDRVYVESAEAVEVQQQVEEG